MSNDKATAEEILVHYSSSSIGRIINRAQKSEPDFKPHGFWISVDTVPDDSWRAWCEAEGFRVGELAVRTRVFLRSDAKILRLAGAEAIDAFTKTYGKDIVRGSGVVGIDWSAVAEEHAGIIIAPYVFERRFTHLWYYGWDCASGCIWDLRAVADLVEVKP